MGGKEGSSTSQVHNTKCLYQKKWRDLMLVTVVTPESYKTRNSIPKEKQARDNQATLKSIKQKKYKELMKWTIGNLTK